MGKQRGTDTGYDSPDISCEHALDGGQEALERHVTSQPFIEAHECLRNHARQKHALSHRMQSGVNLAIPGARTLNKISEEAEFAPSDICESWPAWSGCLRPAFPMHHRVGTGCAGKL